MMRDFLPAEIYVEMNYYQHRCVTATLTSACSTVAHSANGQGGGSHIVMLQ